MLSVETHDHDDTGDDKMNTPSGEANVIWRGNGRSGYEGGML